MLLRKRLLPASLFSLLLLTLSQVGYPQTSHEISIGILDVYTIGYSQESVDRIRNALRAELLAVEQPGVKVLIGSDVVPCGTIHTSHEYFRQSARINGYNYYLISSVLQEAGGLFVDMHLYSVEADQMLWGRSSWYVGTEHLLVCRTGSSTNRDKSYSIIYRFKRRCV